MTKHLSADQYPFCTDRWAPLRSCACVIKKCGCGKTYTRGQWLSLKCLGVADGLDYRNCSCGSTIAIEVHRDP